MLHIIVALVLIQNVNSLDLEHKQTLNNMPFWYQALFIGVVSAIYGLKGADIIKRK